METAISNRHAQSDLPPVLSGNTDTGFLKLIALFFMIIDHIGAIFFSKNPYIIEFRVFGRIAFPIYAWCVVVGSCYTKNPLKYCLRLLILGIISQPLYKSAFHHSWLELNILFLLFLGAAMLWGIRANWYGSRYWVPLLCFLITGFVDVDYGWTGLLLILMLYLARTSKGGLIATFLSFSLFFGAEYGVVQSLFGIPLVMLKIPGIGSVLSSFFTLQSFMWMALPFIAIQTSTRIKLPKTVGYLLYPAHLAVLLAVRFIISPEFALLLQNLK